MTSYCKESSILHTKRADKGIYAISVRGSSSCKVHVGRMVNSNRAVWRFDGGGHDKACGEYDSKSKNRHVDQRDEH